MSETTYHGNDLAAAYKRAKEIRGSIVYSSAPGTRPEDGDFGYWSDDSGFLWNWEREVYRAGQRRSLAAVILAEAKLTR